MGGNEIIKITPAICNARARAEQAGLDTSIYPIRKWGRIYAIIRQVASNGKPFSVVDLVPTLSLKQATVNCCHLCVLGELQRVTAKYKTPAIYKRRGV